jgi:uncharacterized protein YdeI (YjbR/CyaY-like superfamily)
MAIFIESSTLHETPADMVSIFESHPEVLEKWNLLTPLARNEWICWVTIVKTQKTRDEHLVRMTEDLIKGKRRPCCWPGCPHRNKKNEKWFSKNTV